MALHIDPSRMRPDLGPPDPDAVRATIKKLMAFLARHTTDDPSSITQPNFQTVAQLMRYGASLDDIQSMYLKWIKGFGGSTYRAFLHGQDRALGIAWQYQFPPVFPFMDYDPRQRTAPRSGTSGRSGRRPPPPRKKSSASVSSGKTFANGRGVVHKMSGGMSTVFPDVCLTPAPPGSPVPIPYPNVGTSADTAMGPVTVTVESAMPMTKGAMYIKSSGDEPGVAGGVASGRNMGPCEFLSYSFDVKMEGKNVCRMGDPLFHNQKNTMG